MKYLFIAFMSLTSFVFRGQNPSIIPIPNKAEYPIGAYQLPSSLTLSGPKEPTLQVAFNLLTEKIKRQRDINCLGFMVLMLL